MDAVMQLGPPPSVSMLRVGSEPCPGGSTGAASLFLGPIAIIGAIAYLLMCVVAVLLYCLGTNVAMWFVLPWLWLLIT
jgi:hypothetical protein